MRFAFAPARIQKAGLPGPLERALLSIEAQYGPALGAMIERALLGLRAGVEGAAGPLQAALRRGKIAEVLNALPLDALSQRLPRELEPLLLRIHSAGTSRMLGQNPRGPLASFSMRFDLMNPRAAAYAATRSAQLVTAISEETREALRAIVRRGQSAGLTVDEQARAIRPLVGLNGPQASALDRYRRSLAEQGAAPQRIEHLSERYVARGIRYRSRMIARTESAYSAVAGQRDGWDEALQQGLLDPDVQRMEWIASADACQRCLDIAEAGSVPLGSAFESEDGPISGPPLHPHCRCALALAEEPDEAAA